MKMKSKYWQKIYRIMKIKKFFLKKNNTNYDTKKIDFYNIDIDLKVIFKK